MAKGVVPRTARRRYRAGPMIEIAEVSDVTPGLVAAFGRLIPQLSSSSLPPGERELREIVDSPATVLLIAVDRADGGGAPSADAETILGSLTLVLFRIPTGVRAWIEDVVVHDAARGRGVGEALNLRALEIAAERGARSVDLTSRPSREAANRLYRRLGFEPRDTNVYRHHRG